MTTKNTNQNARTQTGFHAFKKMVDDGFERLQNMYGEIARYEKMGLEQANAAIDELAQLVKDGVETSRQFSTELRKLAQETTQRAAEMWSSVKLP